MRPLVAQDEQLRRPCRSVEAVDELGDVEPRGQGQRPHRFGLVSG